MSRDDIIRMMAEAGAGPDDLRPKTYDGIVDTFSRFAELVATAEREACTLAIESMTHGNVKTCAAAVRARDRSIREKVK